jgi:hypothetical protein
MRIRRKHARVRIVCMASTDEIALQARPGTRFFIVSVGHETITRFFIVSVGHETIIDRPTTLKRRV